jgi:thioredoxin-related protein
MIAYISTFIVGLVFLITGLAKSLSSKTFVVHISKYAGHIPMFRLASFQIVQQTAYIFIGLECALGAGLILHLFSQWIIPCSIFLLLSLSLLTIWATIISNITEDCGCYGGLLVVTPVQSIVLNMLYVLLLCLAQIYSRLDYQASIWQYALFIILFFLGYVLSIYSFGQPLFDFLQLKSGKDWKSGWLEEDFKMNQGSYFIVFLSKDCPYCKRWTPLLNVMSIQKNLPQVIGVVSLESDQLEAFKTEYLIRFPIFKMKKLLFKNMVDGVPTAVLIKNGKILEKWEGEIPKEFFEEIKQFYEDIIFTSNSPENRYSG